MKVHPDPSHLVAQERHANEELIEIDPASGCHVWQGRKNAKGYGQVGRHGLAHRVAYEAACGPIPDGLVIDHLCRNRACCNPAHMEPVTPGENVRRGNCPPMVNARKTHCKSGH
jgi:hypothetical protein